MDVLPNEEEEMVRDSLRRFFDTECDTDRVREIEDGEARIDHDLWRQLAELGWLGLALPASYGGGEAPFTQLTLLFEEAGRALAPVPLHPHMVASLALAQAIERGGSALAEERISRACLGEVRLTWAWEERLPIMGPEAISLSAVPDGNGWRLNGSKSMVEAFEISNYCLLAVRTDTTGQASEGISLLLVRPDAEGISSTAHRTLAGDEQSMVQFVRTIFHKAG